MSTSSHNDLIISDAVPFQRRSPQTTLHNSVAHVDNETETVPSHKTDPQILVTPAVVNPLEHSWDTSGGAATPGGTTPDSNEDQGVRDISGASSSQFEFRYTNYTGKGDRTKHSAEAYAQGLWGGSSPPPGGRVEFIESPTPDWLLRFTDHCDKYINQVLTLNNYLLNVNKVLFFIKQHILYSSLLH